MSFAEEFKRIRIKSFLSQEALAQELGVSFSSVNRWESERTKPNMIAMKKLREFCVVHDIDFSILEKEWLESGKEN